ncbi:LysM peptidoglycan-binding domain-containing protein [Spirochaetia bacterium 38H-sp]|uniref:LysM peptidoglycan-binding domain-containing protein n=1 Tax=Rarispira pelagica TaxID=3141764 RepID=A0ABU9UDS9_9SPIR
MITLIFFALVAGNSFSENKKNPVFYRTKNVEKHKEDIYHHNWPKYYSINIPNHQLIQQEIKRLSQGYNKKDLELSIIHSEEYWHYIETMLVKYKAPWELIYLPIVESHYNIYAVSSSGATGLWQFMLNSIHPWMTINQWMDERRDFFKSTEAAIEKLLYNKEITGDWLLAVAAYNAGLGKISRIISSSSTRDYFQLTDNRLLPYQTQYYVARLIAVTYILSNKTKFDISIRWPDAVEWKSLETKKPIMLNLLAKACNIPTHELRKANAELILGISPPGHIIKIKKQYYETAKNIIENHNIPLMDIKIHTIKTGETLSKLSKDYGVPLSLIYLYNPDKDPRKIQIGSSIIIPLVGNKILDKKSSMPQNIVWTEHIVKNGETLWGISRLYSTKVEWISEANNIGINSIIKPGMNLKIPVPKVE